MWSIVAKRLVVAGFVGLAHLCANFAVAAQAEPEAKVVARLYKDYAWQAFANQPDLFGEGLTGASRTRLEEYFAPTLAHLLADDAACQIRTKELCSLDFDPLFNSQDPRVTDLNVEALSLGKVRVQFKDPVTDASTRIDFLLEKVKGKWRIYNVIYIAPEQLSLKDALSRSLPKGGDRHKS